MKTKSFLVLCIVIMHLSVVAQVKIGNNPTAINSASLLELESTSQGFVLPRVSIGSVSSSSPLPSGLLTGTVVYNTNSATTGGSGAGIYYWDGTKWIFISTGSAISSSAWLLTGNSGTSASTNFIGTTDAVDFVAKTANTERMRILGAASGSSKAGWVGMGITVPRSSLDVQGHYSNKNVLTIENSSTSGFSSVDMMDSAGNLKGTFGYANTGTGGIFAGKNYFNTYANDFLFTDNIGNYDFFMKGSNGFVGFNTSTPTERLHVVGNIYLNGAFMPGGSAGTSGYVLTSAGAATSPTWSNLNGLSWLLTGNSGTSYATNFLGTTDNVSMRFRTNNVQRVIIDSLGRVGIGLSNPSYALSVLSASNPLYLSGVQLTGALSTDSILTIYNGIVKKTPFSSIAASTTNTLTLSTNTLTSTVNGVAATSNAVSSVSNISSANTLSTTVNGVTGTTVPIINTNTNALTQSGGLVTTVNGIAATTSIANGTVNNVLGYNSSGTAVYQSLSNISLSTAWNIIGNSGTSYATNFLGTTDNVSMRFRTNNVQRMIIDSLGRVGIGLSNPAYALSVLSASNPLYLSGVQATSTFSADSILTIYNGVVKKAPFSSIAASTTNTLTLNTNTLTSTVNGIAATSNAVSSVSNISSANTLSTTVNGVNGTTVPIINTNTNALTQSGGLVTTVNGVAATTSIANGTVNNVLGYNSSGTAVYQSLNNISLPTAWNINGNSGTSYATNFLGTIDNASMRFRTNNVQRMIIDSLGRVGIGLNNPAYALSVLSASDPLYLSGVQATGTFTSDSILTINAGVVKKAPYSLLNTSWSLTGNSGTNSETNFLGTTDNASLSFRTNNIQRMYIDSANGDVAIGTNTFDLVNPARLRVWYGTTTSHTVGAFYGTINDYLQINLQNRSNGSNASTDYVATADDGTDSTYYIDMGINSSTYAPGVENWGSVHDAYLYANARNLLIGTQSTNSDILFLVSGGKIGTNAAMRINGSNSNIIVGRGENTALAVGNILRGPNSSSGAGGALTLQGGSGATTNTGGALNLNGGANSGSGFGGNVNISGGTSTSGTPGNVIFNTAATERMRLDASGNLGIGLTNASYKLSVLAASNPLYLSGVQATTTFTADSVLTINAGVVKKAAYSSLSVAGNWSLTGNSGTSYATNFLGTTDNVSLRFRTNNTQRMIIDSAGKVGIGTNSPSSDLTLYQSAGSGSSKGFTFTGNSIGNTNTGTGFLMSLGYNTTGNKQLWLGDADYAGNASGSFARFVTTGTVFPVIDAVSGDNTVRRYLSLGVAGDANSGVIFGGDNTNVSPGSQVWDNGNMTIGAGYKSYAAPSNGLLVQGNVGIGTTSPSNALSVSATNPLYLAGVQATTTFTSDSVLTINAGIVKKAPYSSLPAGGGSGWSLTGNSIVAGNFLGTTNAQALVLKANNVQMGYFDGNVSSLALGAGALNGSSDHNVAIGYNATTNNQYTLAVGYNALATGVRSVAIGNGASATTASGAEAIAIGYNAIASNVQTTALGYQATASGSYGLALGYGSLASASQSTAIGYSSLASAQYSNAIGYQANATGLQSTAIGYKAQTAQSNTILLGDVSTPGLHVGIGTASPSAKLDIVASAGNNPLEMTGLPTGVAGTDNVLTINSSGVVGYVTPASFNGSYWNLSGNAAASGSFLGTTNTTALQFKFNSTLAGNLDANNTSFGTSSASASGTSNTAIGYSATASNSATAVGANAVASQANTTAIGNSAVANVTQQATAIGASSQALYQYNVAVGYNAQATLSSQETVVGSSAQAQGQNNISIGYSAKANGSDKITVVGSSAQGSFQNNTAIGYGATAIVNNQATVVGASANAGAQNATALGYSASATGTNSTAIGASATTSQNNAMVLGTSTTNVGIGTSTPNTSTKLDVAGSFKLGSSGSVLSNVIKTTASINPGSMTAGSTVTATATVTGAAIGNSVILNPRSALPTGVIIAYSYINAANTLTVVFTSAVAADPPSTTFDITLIQ